MMKAKKRTKRSRWRGSRTHGRSIKLNKGKGNRGGKGMAGTGKRADHMKSFVIKYLYPYFGKKGFTSKSTERKRIKEINLKDINEILNKFVEEGKAKKGKEGYELELKGYKILGDGEISEKMTIRAKSASKSAKEKVEKAGGKLILEKVQKE
jgi:large subunit ribosomal protein L15